MIMPEKLNPLTFPLHGTRLIEASAGTGKTYTIAALYLRLVLGHGKENGFFRPLIPPEILVVTFTNAATEELRERIRNRLTEAAAFFRGQGDGDEFLENLKAEYDPDHLPGKARLLDQAALWMDESAIHTIHAWCRRMLRQHAFDSLSLFDLELAPSDQDLMEEAACDFWRESFYPQSVETVALLKAVAAITTPQALLKQVSPIINAGIQVNADPFEVLENRRQSIEDARIIWASDFEEAVDRVRKAQTDKTLNNNKYRKASLTGWITQMDLWVNKGGPLPDDQALEKFSAQGLANGVSKKKSPPMHPAYDALDQMNECIDSLDVKQALVSHAAVRINNRITAAKTRLSRMGFNDLLSRLAQALSRPDSHLAEVIRCQFPVAMIDEFQDTDPVQYDSFGTIYLEQEQAGLFMIGDPKQAIYAFRGADIHTYLAARKDTRGRHYTLEKNYRSTKGMVNAVNRMFGQASGFPDGAFLFKDEILFEPVLARGRSEQLMVDGKEATPVTLWQMDQEEPVVKTGPDGYLTRMADAAAGRIVRLLNLGGQTPCRAGFQTEDGQITPLCPSDMAVLVRDGMEARAVRAALEKRRVRSVYLSDRESVFDTQEAVCLLYLLQACMEPSNERMLRTALATPVLDLPLKLLDKLNRDEIAWEAELVRFKLFQKIWRNQGVLPMVRALLLEFNVGARLLSTPSGERQLTNLLHLAELLQTAAATLDGEQALIRWLAGQIEQSAGGVDDEILRLESDRELVRVVTIHKSKGLEYPLVFLPFICSFRNLTARNTPMVKIHDDKGNFRLEVNPGEEELELADKERLAEDLRMLYVALTRSCFACWLGIGVMGKTTKKSGETTTLHQSGMGYLLSGGRMIQTAELSSILTGFKADCLDMTIEPLPVPSLNVFQPGPEPPDLSQAAVFEGIIPRNWRITSYSGILSGAAMPRQEKHFAGYLNEVNEANQANQVNEGIDSPDSAAQDQLLEGETQINLAPRIMADARSIHCFPRGPEPGTFLHDILEWAATHGFDRVAQDRTVILKRIAMLCARRGWDGWAEVLTDWLMEFVTVVLPLPDSPMRLSDLVLNNCRAEMEFMFAAHDVDVCVLDSLVTNNILQGRVRPLLQENLVNGMLKGFIDLVFCFQGRYFVLDYKSNHLGETQDAYGTEAMAHAMLEHRYDLQYVLYTLALHRLLKARLDDYDYDRDVGGVAYLFLRGVTTSGQGLYADKPSKKLITTLDTLFQKGERCQKGKLLQENKQFQEGDPHDTDR